MTLRLFTITVLRGLAFMVFFVLLFLFNPLRWILSLFFVFAAIAAFFFDAGWQYALIIAALRIALESYLAFYPRAWLPEWASEFDRDRRDFTKSPSTRSR